MNCLRVSGPAPMGAGKVGWPWTEESPQLPDTMPEGKPWPVISLVTPSYNQAEYLEESILSVLKQNYPNMQYIVIDGGSTDGSMDIIAKYADVLDYWVSEPDCGQSDALNRGFSRASGEIFSWLNSDDYLLPGALRSVAKAYREFPSAGGWFGSCQRVAAHGAPRGVRHPNRLDFEGLADKKNSWIFQPACFFSAEAWKACGALDTSLSYAMDFDLYLKIAKLYRIHRVDAVLAAARIHDEAKTTREKGMMYAEIWTVQIRHGFERLAMQEMADLWQRHEGLLKEIYQIKASFPYRLARPLLEPFLKKIFP